MRRKQYIIIILQLAQIFLLAVIMVMLSGCMTSKGLHPENSRRNASVHWQMKHDHTKHVVK